MQIPILIERVAGDGYVARGGEPLVLTAEGASQEEALANLKVKLQARLCNGSVVVSLDFPTQPHPLAEFAGMFKDDPLLKEWKKSMAVPISTGPVSRAFLVRPVLLVIFATTCPSLVRNVTLLSCVNVTTADDTTYAALPAYKRDDANFRLSSELQHK